MPITHPQCCCSLALSPTDAASVVARRRRSQLPFFKVYREYYTNYEAGIELLTKLSKKKDVQAYLKYCEEEVSQGHKVAFLLVTPVQRIPRYSLLLKVRQLTHSLTHSLAHSFTLSYRSCSSKRPRAIPTLRTSPRHCGRSRSSRRPSMRASARPTTTASSPSSSRTTRTTLASRRSSLRTARSSTRPMSRSRWARASSRGCCSSTTFSPLLLVTRYVRRCLACASIHRVRARCF